MIYKKLNMLKKQLSSRFFPNEMDRQAEICDALTRDVCNFTVFNQIPGDYYEFGVYKGEGLIRMYHWLSEHWRDYQQLGNDLSLGLGAEYLSAKKFFAFDSFEGLPAENSQHTPTHFIEGAYKSTLDDFLLNVDAAGINNVVPVVGWYDKTLVDTTKQQHGMNKAAIIFIDCDLELSAEYVLDFMTGLIQDGTIIVIDDFFRYNGHPNRGCQGVFNRWTKKCDSFVFNELCRASANRVAFVCNYVGVDILDNGVVNGGSSAIKQKSSHSKERVSA